MGTTTSRALLYEYNARYKEVIPRRRTACFLVLATPNKEIECPSFMALDYLL